MQHHKTPIDGAGLAHNWYIQTLSEVGLLGIIPILYLLFSVIRTLMKQRNEAVKQENNRSWAVIGLVDSVCIALAYSLIEYNLDYFTLWVLLWGTVGLLLPIQQKKKIHVAFAQGMTLLCLVIIAGFLGINLYANTRLNTIETAEKRFLFQPYDTNKTQRYIEYKNIIGQPLTSKERAIILLWHKKHPDVLMTLATAANSGTTEERKHFYDQAIARNPLNTYYYQSYFTFLYETKQTEAMQTLFFAFINQAYHVTHPSSEPEVFFRAGDAILPYLNPELFSLFSGAASFPEVASKVLYFIGLSSLPTAPKLTEELWTLAKDISPDWSSFHMELAAYYLHTANKLGMSRQILFDCQKREAPREACKREMDTFPNILYPGEQQMNVKMIPEFY